MGNSQGSSASGSNSSNSGDNNKQAKNIDFSGQTHKTKQDIGGKVDVGVNSNNGIGKKGKS